METLKYYVAKIYLDHGTLIIDATNDSMSDRHYNVVIEFEEKDKIIVRSTKANFRMNSSIADSKIPKKDWHLYTDDSFTHSWFLWPFLAPRSILRRGYVELKEGTARCYTSTNWTIIDKNISKSQNK